MKVFKAKSLQINCTLTLLFLIDSWPIFHWVSHMSLHISWKPWDLFIYNFFIYLYLHLLRESLTWCWCWCVPSLPAIIWWPLFRSSWERRQCLFWILVPPPPSLPPPGSNILFETLNYQNNPFSIDFKQSMLHLLNLWYVSIIWKIGRFFANYVG